MKRIQLSLKDGLGFEDAAHSFANRKANKNVGYESVGSFTRILLPNKRLIYANEWKDI